MLRRRNSFHVAADTRKKKGAEAPLRSTARGSGRRRLGLRLVAATGRLNVECRLAVRIDIDGQATTVHQPTHDMGRLATLALIDAMREPHSAPILKVPYTLQLRNSTGPAPR